MKVPSGRVLAFGAIWAAVTAAALLIPGCYGNNCVGGAEVFGADAGQGVMLGPDMWASGPVDGPWLWFPRQHLYFFELPQFGGRIPQVVIPELSAAPQPLKTNSDNVIGAGNIALVSGRGPNRLAVKNDTCSDYYLHVTAFAGPLTPATEADAADAGITDAAPANDAEAGPP